MKIKTSLNTFVGNLKFVKPNPKIRTSKTAYYNDFIQISGGGPSRNLFLYPIKNRKLDEISISFCNIISALNKFAKYVIYQNPSLLNVLKLPTLDLDSIKKRNPDYLFNYTRIDSIFNGSEYRVLEVNSKRPQLYEDTDWFSSYLQHLFPDQIMVDHTTDHITSSIKGGYLLNHPHPPENIILISGFINFLKDKPFGSFFYSAIKNTFANSNIMSFSCDEYKQILNQFEQKHNSVYYNNHKVDLIIFQDLCSGNMAHLHKGGITNPKLQKAYQSLNLEFSSPPSSWLIGNKLNLPLIQNPEIQSKIGLSSNEIDSIKLILTNLSVNNLKKVKRVNKNKYVIKLPSVGGGKGVFIGSRLSEKKFYSIINNSLEEHDEIILQKKVNFGLDKIIDFQSFKPKLAAVTLDPFVINRPDLNPHFYVSGFSTRAILKKHLNPNVKFNPETNRSDILFGAVLGYG